MTADLSMLKPGIYRKGEPGFILPGSPLHSAVLSPSKVAALLGVSRWESEYRLWHRMKGITPPEPDKDDFRIGHAFESTLAFMWRADNPEWQLSPGEVQIVGDPKQWGFPFVVTLDRRAVMMNRRMRRIVEFKTCRGWDEWGDDGTDECPADYLLQVICQMLLSGMTDIPAQLMVMNRFGCVFHTYTIEYNEEVARAILKACWSFWQKLQAATPPELDDSVATYECVREQHPEIDKDAEAVIPVELATEFHESIAALDAAKTRERFAKTKVLDLMARANFARAGDQRIARRQPTGKGAVALYQIKPGSRAASATVSEGEPAA